ncbi:hypothetical protein AB0J57_31950 [Streptomyces sp. NPDC049837]|uniref:hypothetical protein n=1 Tax=Streptomyces sp. NPDC049837 TaxID=3155277 RepID=UPI00343DA16E
MADQVGEHGERYAAAHGGRHPYTDCWPRAMGVAVWGYEDGNAERLVTGIAEAMRLAMARHDVPVARLGIDAARDELWYWVGDDGPLRAVPGSAEWPAPTGPHAASWRRHFADAGLDEVRRTAQTVDSVLTALLHYTAERFPDVPATFGAVLKEYEDAVSGRAFFSLAQEPSPPP